MCFALSDSDNSTFRPPTPLDFYITVLHPAGQLASRACYHFPQISECARYADGATQSKISTLECFPGDNLN